MKKSYQLLLTGLMLGFSPLALAEDCIDRSGEVRELGARVVNINKQPYYSFLTIGKCKIYYGALVGTDGSITLKTDHDLEVSEDQLKIGTLTQAIPDFEIEDHIAHNSDPNNLIQLAPFLQILSAEQVLSKYYDPNDEEWTEFKEVRLVVLNTETNARYLLVQRQ